MCRMIAFRSDDPRRRADLLRTFRTQASHGYTGPEDHRRHPDGWGIAAPVGGRIVHVGRSVEDASRDPAFDAAVVAAGASDPGWVVGHVRNASVGATRVENSHPFIRDGWAFAHNGTIHDLDPPRGLAPEGETDSERFFLHLLAERAKTQSWTEAIARVVRRITRDHRHSSLTFLLADGRELYAFRKVGPEPGSCGTMECLLEHYALGVGRIDGEPILIQERQLLPGLRQWEAIRDGVVLRFRADGGIERTGILPSLSGEARGVPVEA